MTQYAVLKNVVIDQPDEENLQVVCCDHIFQQDVEQKASDRFGLRIQEDRLLQVFHLWNDCYHHHHISKPMEAVENLKSIGMGKKKSFGNSTR